MIFGKVLVDLGQIFIGFICNLQVHFSQILLVLRSVFVQCHIKHQSF